MGVKAKKAMKKNLKKASSQLPVSSRKDEALDFLPLEGGPGRKLPEQKPSEDKATVLYMGRIPHGFYEKEMEGIACSVVQIRKYPFPLPRHWLPRCCLQSDLEHNTVDNRHG
uniref:Uncharacterized protein n=1 Tax=Fagus sylvatica TaxID=28930 RepID=A0A2N9HY36_FAGSY